MTEEGVCQSGGGGVWTGGDLMVTICCGPRINPKGGAPWPILCEGANLLFGNLACLALHHRWNDKGGSASRRGAGGPWSPLRSFGHHLWSLLSLIMFSSIFDISHKDGYHSSLLFKIDTCNKSQTPLSLGQSSTWTCWPSWTAAGICTRGICFFRKGVQKWLLWLYCLRQTCNKNQFGTIFHLEQNFCLLGWQTL